MLFFIGKEILNFSVIEVIHFVVRAHGILLKRPFLLLNHKNILHFLLFILWLYFSSVFFLSLVHLGLGAGYSHIIL